MLHFTDTETTGVHADAEVIELAIVRWTDGNTQPLLHEYYLPRTPPTPELAAINGYDAEVWATRGANKWTAVDCEVVADALKRQTLAGSNPAFDMARIRFECERMAKPVPQWNYRALDTSSLAMPLWMTSAVDNTKLATLAKYFGLEEQKHTALADCYTAIGVWEKLYDLYLYKPKAMREGLLEIANDPATDKVLRDFARELLQ